MRSKSLRETTVGALTAETQLSCYQTCMILFAPSNAQHTLQKFDKKPRRHALDSHFPASNKMPPRAT